MARLLTSPDVAVLRPASLARRRGRSQRNAEGERSRNIWRALGASVLLLAAIGGALLVGAHAHRIIEFMTVRDRGVKDLAPSGAQREELRSGTILFALPDGENCRPMHFDNQTAAISPGRGTVPCYTREPRQGAAPSEGKFSWRSGR